MPSTDLYEVSEVKLVIDCRLGRRGALRFVKIGDVRKSNRETDSVIRGDPPFYGRWEKLTGGMGSYPNDASFGKSGHSLVLNGQTLLLLRGTSVIGASTYRETVAAERRPTVRAEVGDGDSRRSACRRSGTSNSPRGRGRTDPTEPQRQCQVSQHLPKGQGCDPVVAQHMSLVTLVSASIQAWTRSRAIESPTTSTPLP